MIATALRDKGFENIDSSDRHPEPLLVSGLKILMENGKSNLGWRIIAGVLMKKEEFDALLRKTEGKSPKPLEELIGASIKTKAQGMIKTLKRVTGNANLDGQAIKDLDEIGLTPYELIKEFLADEILSDTRGGAVAVKKIPIKVTTIESSKGLAADFVFITHFDDQYFVTRGKKSFAMCDRDVCKFLVALTRAKSKVFLVSSRKQDPEFLRWIKKERINRE